VKKNSGRGDLPYIEEKKKKGKEPERKKKKKARPPSGAKSHGVKTAIFWREGGIPQADREKKKSHGKKKIRVARGEKPQAGFQQQWGKKGSIKKMGGSHLGEKIELNKKKEGTVSLPARIPPPSIGG